jgi:UDP-glucose 4-epimerase
MPMRVLITGGSGFIGCHLVEALLRRGAAVRVMDNLATGHRANLAQALAYVGVQGEFTFVQGDITDRAGDRFYPASSRSALGTTVG